MKRIILFLVFSTLLSLTFNTQKVLSENNFRVKVEITGDENIKGTISSYIKRELRSLNDIEPVDDNPNWIMEIVAVELTNLLGVQTGYVLSVIILDTYGQMVISALLPQSENESEEMEKIRTEQIKGLYYHPQHLVEVGSTEQLRNMCNNIVAKFDTICVEEMRTLIQELREKQFK